MKITVIASLLVLMMTFTPVIADRQVPSHFCFKPERPLLMASPYHHKRYEKDVKTYKFCIREYVKTQERAIVMHQEAIKKATDDWNEFVQEDQ